MLHRTHPQLHAPLVVWLVTLAGDWVKLRNVQGAYQPIEAQQDQGPPRQLWIANMKLNDRAVVSKVPAWAYDPKVLLA